MQCTPFLDQPQCSFAEISVEHLARFDEVRSFGASILGMEMRRCVIVVVQRDNDAEKAAHLGQVRLPAFNIASSVRETCSCCRVTDD